MKSVQIVEIGAPLEARELPRPEPGAGELRVRVQAAGICHSDAHYRAGTGKVAHLPMTPGHEVAGVVEAVGPGVRERKLGERVALHYLVTCGRCAFCARGLEQFCPAAQMLGKDRPGGYAECIVVPERNAIPVPDAVGIEAAAIMMCSTSTAFHALRKARLAPGERVAVFGVGGLGMSAVQLARICGAAEVFAVDVNREKLAAAAGYGALPIDPADDAPDAQIREATHGAGVDVALELAGLPATQTQAVRALAVQGRAALAAISGETFALNAYRDLIAREAEVIGVSDHQHGELGTLMGFAARGLLDLDSVIAERLPLEAAPINARLDDLAGFRGRTRSVITP